MKTRILSLLAFAGLIGSLAFAAAQDGKPQEQGGALSAAKPVESGDAKIIASQLPAYPLEVCPVSDEKLGSMGDPVDVVVDGRLVRLCCAGCKKGVEKSKAEIIAKLDAAVIAEQKPMWPAALATCPVSGEAFVEAETIDYVHGTRYVKLCCAGCKKGVTKSADALFAKIDEAMAAEQRASYPLETCVVSGKPIDAATANETFYGVTLVRFCCPRCPAAFEKNPASFVAKVKEARKGKSGAAVGGAKKG